MIHEGLIYRDSQFITWRPTWGTGQDRKIDLKCL